MAVQGFLNILSLLLFNYISNTANPRSIFFYRFPKRKIAQAETKNKLCIAVWSTAQYPVIMQNKRHKPDR